MHPSSRNCPRVLSVGTCYSQSCPYNHDIPNCKSCLLVFDTEDEYQNHLTSGHVQGHTPDSMALDVVSPNVQPRTPKDKFCDFCEMEVAAAHWNNHLRCSKHISRQTVIRYNAAMEKTNADKHGIVIEGIFDFDCITPQAAKRGVKNSITVRAAQQVTQCILLEIKLSSSHGAKFANSGFQVYRESDSLMLSGSKPFALSVVFKQTYPGRYEARLEFIFQDTRLGQPFIITRALKAVVGDKALLHELTPKTPYMPPTESAMKDVKEVIGGAKTAALKAIRYKAKLPQAPIPSPLHDLLSRSEPIAQISKEIKKLFLPESLTTASYRQFFEQLLWVEEMKMEQDSTKFDMTNVALTRHNSLYYLSVPGLAEKRPAVLLDDSIVVQEQNANNDKWYEGRVHVIRKAEVGLRFHNSFDDFHEGKRFHLRFKLSRLSIRRQHQALDFNQDRILFPEEAHLPVRSISETRLDLFNPLIANNEPQIQAISSILSLPPGSPPFIVFGPPGTGKTLTIVEAMQQILSKYGNAKILACAPSNSAADLIATRLTSRLSPKELFRFYAPTRSQDLIPDELQKFVYTDNHGSLSIPSDPSPKAALNAFRVVVTTCQSGSVAHGIGLPRGSFTHIFIDEAGQATEPEALVPVRTMADAKTNVILSGDPKQLGPVIKSSIANELGLGQSYLERLMSRQVYNPKSHYTKSVVKLTKNFRSHQAILAFPNERFYDGDLEQCADPSTIDCFLNSHLLPSKQFPVIFHAVSGKNDRESTSPSFFNIDEIALVRSYVENLKDHRDFPIADEDIGIISPYHAQCTRLRANLNATDKLKIGSVEEFQGQERKVIIISTVRSSREFVEYDLRHTLGFVASPGRFNVAITRAQALLIVIGDPNVLSLDPLWRSFLNYVYLNRGWKGPGISWNPNKPVNEAGGYDKILREAASVGMEEFTKRIKMIDEPWLDLV